MNNLGGNITLNTTCTKRKHKVLPKP